jgi:hypothetical protein
VAYVQAPKAKGHRSLSIGFRTPRPRVILYVVTFSGIELQALDGVTVSSDCRAAACALQDLPQGQVPLEMNPQPEVMEMARTAAVRRGGDLRFHIVLRRGLALSTLSPEPEMQRLALGCIAHKAARMWNTRAIFTGCFPTAMENRWSAATGPDRLF